MIFGLNLVGLCLGFSFPLASSASLAWILGLGFPAILQTRYDLGCGISLLNFSTFEAVLASFLNHLLPYSPLLPIREALDLLPELMVFPASGILRKHPSSPATSPVLQGLRWGGGVRGALLLKWTAEVPVGLFSGTDLSPLPHLREPLCYSWAQSSLVLFLSVEKWQPGELAEKCFSKLGRGIGEEHIQHLLASLTESKLFFFSCFKIRLSFQVLMRVIGWY